MGKKFTYLFILIFLFLFNVTVRAQAPFISYNPPSNIYAVNTPILPLIPANTGGAMPSTAYAAVTTLTTSPLLSAPQDMVLDGLGNMYVADYGDHTIKKVVLSTNAVSIIAGKQNTAGEVNNARGTSATFTTPSGIAYDGTGNLYVADYLTGTIRKISTIAPYAVTTFAGTAGANSEFDATGAAAKFWGPHSLVYDASTRALYVTDFLGGKLRKITIPGAVVTTLTSVPGASFIAYDGSTNFYITTGTGNTILKVASKSPYAVSTFAGSGVAAEVDATGIAAGFNRPSGIIYTTSGFLFVADNGGYAIRRISVPGGVVTTEAGSTFGTMDGIGTAAQFKGPNGIVGNNAGIAYISDNVAKSIRQANSFGYTITPALPGNLSFDPSTGAITGTPSVAQPAAAYTVTATNSSGSGTTTVTIAIGQIHDWVGNNSTAWTNANNWNPIGAPSSVDFVRIGHYGYKSLKPPLIHTAIKVGTLIFGLQSPVLNFSNSGSLTVGSGLILEDGATPIITGAGDINIGPGALVTIPTSPNTNLTLNITGKFTLQSSALGDAAIGPINTSSIAGTAASAIVVQRYLSDNRNYRLLSSPINSASKTNGSNTFNIYSVNFLKDSTFLTGTAGVPGGFNKGGNPTLYLYRENLTPAYTSFLNSNFRGISDISASPNYTIDLDGGPFNIPVANGYLFFFRGGLNTVNPFTAGSSAKSATVTTSGTLNIGPITVTNWFTPGSTGLSYTASSPVQVAGFNLVGNPYPSAIDWDKFQTASSSTGIYGSGISSAIYMLDPISKNFGSYIAGHNGVGSATFVSNIISVGQGFFVTALPTGAHQLTFNESAKTTAYNIKPKLLMGEPVERAADQYIRLRLEQDSVTSDQTLVFFNNSASFAYDPNSDAPYKTGYGTVSLSSRSQELIDLSINTVPLPKLKADSIKLNVDATSDGAYKLIMTDIVALPKLFSIGLIDAYKKTLFNLRERNTYNFNILKSDNASHGPNRFTLFISQNAAYVYHLLSFAATKASGNQVNLAWKTANEESYVNFTVERSIDNGQTFNYVGSIRGAGLGSYSVVDKNPINGLNLYRLKQDGIYSGISYSQVLSVQYTNGNSTLANINIYPNPASNIINLDIKPLNNEAIIYDIKFVTSLGILVKEIISSQPSWSGSIDQLQSGIYIVRVTNNKNQNLIGEGKFVKQ